MHKTVFEDLQNNINWLAQCQRRKRYPVDQSDKCGLTAFEYGWKSFNNLYSEFSAGDDRKKMYLCIEKYINTDKFVERYERDIKSFCRCEHRIYLEDDQYRDLNPRLSKKVSSLKSQLNDRDSEKIIKSLIDCLYLIRNARVHGSFGTSKTSFSFLPKIIYIINVEILVGKLGVSINQIEAEVESALSNLKKTSVPNK